jgi:hypothetical protein
MASFGKILLGLLVPYGTRITKIAQANGLPIAKANQNFVFIFNNHVLG